MTLLHAPACIHPQCTPDWNDVTLVLLVPSQSAAMCTALVVYLLPSTLNMRLQATAAKQKAVQELADAKKKFVHMTRRRQAEHAAKVGPYISVLVNGRSEHAFGYTLQVVARC
jgi:hypothetical protein